MHTLVLSLVSLTSLASLILSVLSLEHKPVKEEYVILNILGLSLLFLAMGLRGLVYNTMTNTKMLLQWLSIVGSGVALASAAVAYGANINNDDLNVLLGLSLVSLSVSSLLGHFMKYPKEDSEKKENSWLKTLRLILIFVAPVLHIVNLVDENNIYKKLNPAVAFSFLIFAFSVIWFYVGHFKVFFSDENLKESEIRLGSLIDFGNAYELLESNTTKLLNILSSAVLLSSFGIFYGHANNDLDLLGGVVILVVILIDHYLSH